jgi:hypothetical protein
LPLHSSDLLGAGHHGHLPALGRALGRSLHCSGVLWLGCAREWLHLRSMLADSTWPREYWQLCCCNLSPGGLWDRFSR